MNVRSKRRRRNEKQKMSLIILFFIIIAVADYDDMYDRAVLMHGAKGDLIRRNAYNAYAECLRKTGDEEAARKYGMDVIQKHIFEIFNVLTPPNRPTAPPSACLG